MMQIDVAEKLITELMAVRGMCREEAVVAVVTMDSRERHFGRTPVTGNPAALLTRAATVDLVQIRA